VKQLLLGLASALFVVAVPLGVLSASAVASIFDPAFYTEQQVRVGVEEAYGLPRAVLGPVNQGMVRYFAGEVATLPEAFRASGADPAFFTERELVHMTDVRTLFQQMALVERVTLAYGILFLLGSYLVLGSSAIRRDGGLLLLGAGVALAIFILGGAIWLINPSGLFLQFHELYFSNDFWQLDPRTDHLIQLVPFPFWVAAISIVIGRAVAATAVTGAVGGLLVWLGGRLR
jgi:integral membrane protein (TIGR01906 family)